MIDLLAWLLFGHLLAAGTTTQVRTYREGLHGCHPEYRQRWLWYPAKTGRIVCNLEDGQIVIYGELK